MDNKHNSTIDFSNFFRKQKPNENLQNKNSNLRDGRLSLNKKNKIYLIIISIIVLIIIFMFLYNLKTKENTIIPDIPPKYAPPAELQTEPEYTPPFP